MAEEKSAEPKQQMKTGRWTIIMSVTLPKHSDVHEIYAVIHAHIY